MTKIVFIGLGIMGLPMATNLVKAGFDVTGVNRSQAAEERLAASGGRRTDNLPQAIAEADVVVTMLPDTPDVTTVLAGDEGVFTHATAGTLVIDFSTIRPDASRELSELGSAKGIDVLDAPVSGGDSGAIQGILSIMVGGEQAAFERAQPVFDAVGKTIVRVGTAGAGQTVKAANQIIVANNLQALAEAIVFLEANDVDAETAVSVLSGGLAGSTVMERKGPQMLRRDFTPGFKTELHHKDLGITLDTARSKKVVLPLSALSAQFIAALNAQGRGANDHTELISLVEAVSGR